jgi:hypothetical protein
MFGDIKKGGSMRDQENWLKREIKKSTAETESWPLWRQESISAVQVTKSAVESQNNKKRQIRK